MRETCIYYAPPLGTVRGIESGAVLADVPCQVPRGDATTSLLRRSRSRTNSNEYIPLDRLKTILTFHRAVRIRRDWHHDLLLLLTFRCSNFCVSSIFYFSYLFTFFNRCVSIRSNYLTFPSLSENSILHIFFLSFCTAPPFSTDLRFRFTRISVIIENKKTSDDCAS